jgi:hypothetical protein
MSERPRYYEGEYLRAFDFDAEQSYHLEMRRRLNLALHLWGIVEGLELLMGADEAGGTKGQAYISAGIAIDAYGREIIVPANHPLADDLENNRITGAGTYSVWLAYRRELATLPEGSYRLCNATDQFTRWQESFEVLIKDSALANPNPPEPEAFEALSDDPEKSPWLVRLGEVFVDPSNPLQKVTNPANTGRIYIGLRAQRIFTPRDPGIDFHVLEPNAALDPLTSIALETNLFTKQNVIVGTNFEVKQSDIKPTPAPIAPAVFPNLTGNLKAAGDIFLQGNLYSNVGGNWIGLAEYIKRFTPDILTGIQDIPFATASTAPQATDTLIFTIASDRLTKMGSAHGTASIAGIKWNTRTELDVIYAGAAQALFQINNVTVTPKAAPLNSCDVAVTWTVGSTLTDLTKFRSAIVSFSIAYVVVCYP